MVSFGLMGQFGEREWGKPIRWGKFSEIHNAVSSNLRTAKFAGTTTSAERSARIVTEYSPTAPLREPCAEGRHYACGSKECSCSCHQAEKKTASPKAALVFVGVLIFGVIALVCFKATKPAPAPPPATQLSQPAIKFVTLVLVDDIESGLLNRHSQLADMPGENLLDWAGLDLKITARAYEAAYDNNEIAADNEYKGKKILASGTVLRIEKDFTGGGNIWLRGSGLMGIHAQLSNRGRAGAASFSTGQQVNLVCNGAGRLLTIAGLDTCESLSDYMKEMAPSVNSKVADFLAGRTSMRSSTAKAITSLYVAGMHLPPDSPCFAGNEDRCLAEMTTLFKDKATAQTINNESEQMVASLKVN